MPLGEGTIPYEEVLGLLKQNNPQMDCTIECSSLEKVKKSYACLKSVKRKWYLMKNKKGHILAKTRMCPCKYDCGLADLYCQAYP